MQHLTANQLAKIIANAASAGIRQDWANAKGSGNQKQSQAWFDFGWPDQLSFDNFHKMYKRGGIARCVISTPPDVCWKSAPLVYEGKSSDDASKRDRTAFERAYDELSDRLSLVRNLHQADTKGRVGYYSALIIQIAGTGDEIAWEKPIGRVRPDQVVKLIPVYSEQLKPSTWDENRSSIRYGMPLTYNYQESAVGDTEDSIQRTETIHHSRVIIFTEQPESESIRGLPQLESCFNDLLMIELICGAGGQGFWKNAAGKMMFSLSDKQAAPPSQEERQEMDEALREFAEQLDKSVYAGGIDVTQLQAALDNPDPFYQMYISNIAAASRIPKNRLSGSQTGVLAGDKDEAAFLSEMISRCNNWCVNMVNLFVDWCIDHGALPKVRYGVQFEDLLSASDESKLTLADKMTQANDRHISAQIKAGSQDVTPLFSNEEIRLMAGYTEPVKVTYQQEVDIIDEPEDAE
jgi:uncharacterized protein